MGVSITVRHGFTGKQATNMTRLTVGRYCCNNKTKAIVETEWEQWQLLEHADENRIRIIATMTLHTTVPFDTIIVFIISFQLK